MNYKTTMEEMRDRLMKILEKYESYKIINLLIDKIINSKIDKEIVCIVVNLKVEELTGGKNNWA